MNADTLYITIKDACVTRIAALALASDDATWGINDHVYSQLAEDLANTEHPCVIVTTEGERIEEWGGTTLDFNYWYPVRVMLIDAESSRQHNREADYQAWLLAIHDAFNNKRLTGVNNVQRCLVQPGINFQPKLSQFQFLAGSMLLRFFVSLDRNTTF